MSARVLLVGAGGLGCAVGLALARTPRPLELTVADPDVVEPSNLQRQVLFGRDDVGRPKAVAAAAAIAHASRGARVRATPRVARVSTDDAVGLAGAHDLVIEGTDRIETKFLVADACAIAGVPAVHAGVVRWAGWAMATDARRGACLRCFFEDIPDGARAPTCAEDGVFGPVVGAVGAIQASLALRLLEGDDAIGTIARFDGLAGTWRSSRLARRAGCPLCGPERTIQAMDADRYAPRICAR